MRLLNDLAKFLKSIFSPATETDNLTLTPAVKPENPKKPEPRFLLPKTAGKYCRLLVEGADLVAGLYSQFVAEAEDLRCAAAILLSQAATLETLGKNDAARELNRREAARLRDQAEKKNQKANSLTNQEIWVEVKKRAVGSDFTPEANADWLYERPLAAEWAEKHAREAEQLEIISEGKKFHSKVAPISNDLEIIIEAGYPPEIWDKVERRLISFNGRFFVCQLRTPAIITRSEHGDNTKYRPTGRYGEQTIEWMTDSVSQMTDEELRLDRFHFTKNPRHAGLFQYSILLLNFLLLPACRSSKGA